MKHSKKGIIAAQFNWIFILIVGVVIIAFFLTTSRHQEQNADVELAVSFLRHLDPILSASERSPGTLQKISMPDMKMGFTCEDTYSKLIVGDGYEQDLTYSIIFATSVIRHRTLYTWSLDWNTPYKVAPFLYLTTPDTKFYFVNDTGSRAETLYKGFPKNVTVEFVTSAVPRTDYGRHVFIYFSDADVQGIANSLPGDNVYGIKITPNDPPNILGSYGKVTFTTGLGFGSPSESLYLGLPLLYGAIFSEDREFYDCTFKKAMKRFEIANKLNKDRIKEIERRLPALDPCKPRYASPLISFANIAGINFDDPGMDDLAKVYDGAQTLQRANEDLVRGHRCALIY
ncbi:MAG: hypothetical protein ABIE94_04950 [archaeon]